MKPSHPLTPASAVLALSFVFSLTLGLLPAGAQDVNIDAASVLKRLEVLKSTQKNAKDQLLQSAYQKVLAASATPGAAWGFYLDAVKETKFSGKTGAAGDFQEWRKKEGENQKTEAMETALPLSLRYLALTIRKAGGEKNATLVPDLNRYVESLAEAERALSKSGGFAGESAQIMNKPVTDSIFANYLDLTGQLGNIKDWELSPGNLQGILEKTLRPLLREAKNPAVVQTWDWQIKIEGEKTQGGKLAMDQERFQQVRLPSMRWNQAKEYIVIEQPGRAATEMIAIIEANPAHPEADRWMTELEQVLKQKLPAPPATE